MVSVCMITYNHQDYIEEALQSIFKQECDFDIELIVSNDCSTDQTHQVISEFLKNNTKTNIKVNYFNHTKNLGITSNFVYALKQCNGKYIAICEGDDYWVDILKLQKQIDFLEKNNSFSAIASNSLVIHENTEKEHLFREPIEKVFSINELLEARHFHTATFLFKREFFKNDFPTNVLSADRTLFLLISCFGKIKLTKDVTAVYRKNDGGISRRVTSKQMRLDYKIVNYLKKYNKHFNQNKLKCFISKTVLEYSFKINLFDFTKASFNYSFCKFKEAKGFRKKIRSLIYSFRKIKEFTYKLDF